MPQPDRAAVDVVSGLREHLIGKARAEVARLAAADSDWYDFTADLDRQRRRLAALMAGEDVPVERCDLPRELHPPHLDTRHFTLRGDRLVDARNARSGHATRRMS